MMEIKNKKCDRNSTIRYQFCPLCAGRLKEKVIHQHRRLVCERCGFIFYLNSKPGVSGLIIHQGKILLLRRAINPAKESWALPSGFLENGEAPEKGLMREVKEETGYQIKVGQLFKTAVHRYQNEDTPPCYILALYYQARLIGGRASLDHENEALDWFNPVHLPINMFPQHRRVIYEMVNNFSDDKSRD